MKYLVGIAIAGVAFAVGTGAVRAVEFAIGEVWPVDVSVTRVPEKSDENGLIDSELADYVNVNINGLRIRSNESEIIRRLGKPVKITPYGVEPEYPVREYEYPGLSVTVDRFEGHPTIGAFSISSREWDLNGVSIGSSVDDVHRLLGRPYFEDKDSMEYTDTCDWLVSITLKDGRVSEIIVDYPGD